MSSRLFFMICAASVVLFGATETATACTVALKRGETTEEFRTRHLKKAIVIAGTLSVLEAPASQERHARGDLLSGPLTSATVTDVHGRTFAVTFVPPGPWLSNDTDCGIFNLPEGPVAKGTFYLVREKRNSFHLLHYVPAAEG